MHTLQSRLMHVSYVKCALNLTWTLILHYLSQGQSKFTYNLLENALKIISSKILSLNTRSIVWYKYYTVRLFIYILVHRSQYLYLKKKKTMKFNRLLCTNLSTTFCDGSDYKLVLWSNDKSQWINLIKIENLICWCDC